MELKINLEYEKLLPNLNPEQFAALKKSIQEEGQHYPIAYNSESEVLDGHHRLKVCQELNLTPLIETEPRIFKDKLSEKQFVLETNLIRRHLDTWYRIMVAKPLLLIYREKAEQRQRLAGELFGSGKQLRQEFAEPISEGKAIEQFATTVHSNPETVRQALFIEEKARPEIIEKLGNGEITINAAYVQTKSDERRNEIPQAMPPLPDGKYRCIVIDPPWEMEKIEREVVPNQTKELDYPTMTIEELSNLPIANLADSDGCHVYLWVTQKHLPDGLKLFESWGVKYQCILTWVKNVGFTPFSWMYTTEHVLFGRIGSLQLLKLGMRLDFSEVRREHSRKPDIFFDIVKQASPEPRLEMFGRELREGFKVWGNEPNKF